MVLKLKKLFLAALAGSVTMWLLAGLWHIVLMPHFYKIEVQADHEGKGIIIMAYLLLGLLMTFLYSKLNKKAKPVIEGLKFGMLIGILWVFPHELVDAGAHGESLSYVFKNAAWHVIEQGAGGIVIGLIYKKQ